MATLHEPEFHVGTQLSDLSCTIQSLQKQSQAARTQVSYVCLKSSAVIGVKTADYFEFDQRIDG